MRLAALAAAALACATAPDRGPAAPAPLEPQALLGRCARGFADACRELGRARLSGERTERDERLGAALLTEACELGDSAACGDLGVLHAIGLGVPQSDARAAALAHRACEQGAALSCSNQGALLAEGVGPPSERSGERVVRLFRTACDAGVPEGCVNLGTALEAGRLSPRDLRAAASAYRRACDAGLALACHRLAILVSERSDVAPGLTATALEARACLAGIAPACAAASERTSPASARTPAARLVDVRESYALGIPGTGGFSPGELATVRATGPRRTVADVRRPPASMVAGLDAELRARLGLDLPPRPDGDDPPVRLLVAFRRSLLGQCYEAPRPPGAQRTEAFARFFVDADGRPVDVRVATVPQDSAVEGCVGELVAAWEFPASAEGATGPFLVRHVYEAGFAGPPPQYAGPGSLRPALRDPRCVERGVALPAGYRDAAGEVAVKLAVDRSGRPGLLHALSPVPEAIVDAVAEAVRGCAWSPGADADGRPASLWVTLKVNLEPR